jgi:alanine racemase
MTRPCDIIIHDSALLHNVAVVRRAAPDSRVMAMVKANAYGHGLARVANVLAGVVDAFGVACLAEAQVIRQLGIDAPIVLMEGFFQAEELAAVAQLNLQIVLHSPQQLAILQQTRLSTPVTVWLKVDSGMHRLGFSVADVPGVAQTLQALPHVTQPIGWMTHFAQADARQHPKTQNQIDMFHTLTQAAAGSKSLANSAGILAWPEAHADWVRPGIMLYGVSPFASQTGRDFQLQPVMQLRSQLIAINQVSKGEAIGYGCTWVCPQSVPVGIVAVGYGDGYPRNVPNGTPVWIDGRYVPTVGRVSMDMLAVDLRTYPQARVGDIVELWGSHLPVEHIAQRVGTIAYEVLCHVNER